MLDLMQQANSRKSELLPQKKFAFRSRKKEGISSNNMPDGVVKADAKNLPVKKVTVEDNSRKVRDRTDEKIVMAVRTF